MCVILGQVVVKCDFTSPRNPITTLYNSVPKVVEVNGYEDYGEWTAYQYYSGATRAQIQALKVIKII